MMIEMSRMSRETNERGEVERKGERVRESVATWYMGYANVSRITIEHWTLYPTLILWLYCSPGGKKKICRPIAHKAHAHSPLASS